MTTYGNQLNTDSSAVPTSHEYGDDGAGVSRWHMWTRSKGQGEYDDAAVTDPTANSSVIATLKGILTFLRVSAAGVGKAEDAAAADGDTGVSVLSVRRDAAASSAGTDGDYATINTDATGQVWTVDAAVATAVGAGNATLTTIDTAVDLTNTKLDVVTAKVGALSNDTSAALEASRVVKASAGTVFGLSGYSTTAQFLQIHDAASLPADTAVPAVVIPITAGAEFSIDFGVYGRAFGTGIVVCVSTTGPTKTIGGADTWFDVRYN